MRSLNPELICAQDREWEISPRADHLLNLIGELNTDALDRQLRLFATSCARRFWHLLGESCRRAIVQAELFAQGAPSRQDEMKETLREAGEAFLAKHRLVIGDEFAALVERRPADFRDERELNRALLHAQMHAAYLAMKTTFGYSYQTCEGYKAARICSQTAIETIKWLARARGFDPAVVEETIDEEHRRQAEALRLLLGNPLRQNGSPPMTIAGAREAQSSAAGVAETAASHSNWHELLGRACSRFILGIADRVRPRDRLRVSKSGVV